MVLSLGFTPNECVKDMSKAVETTYAACPAWRFILIRQMAPLYVRTLSVCRTRDPCLNGFILKCLLHRKI